jgi:uncharacterized protein (DUF2345 family)
MSSHISAEQLLLDKLLVAANVSQEKQIEHLKEAVRILTRHVAQLEHVISASQHQVVIKTGAASIVLKADGSIDLKGARNLALETTGHITVKAGGRLILKGDTIQEN